MCTTISTLGDILTLVNQIDFRYDLVLLIDVLEHFSKIDGKSLLNKIAEKNKVILISTPKNPTVQTQAFGNIYETHRSRWGKQELAGIGNSFFISDSVSLIGYVSKEEHVQRLKNELIVMKIKENPEISSLISNWKYHTNKYITKKLFQKQTKKNQRISMKLLICIYLYDDNLAN